MERKKLYLYVGIPVLAIIAAISYHRVQRNKELSHQREQKDQGLVPVTLVPVETRPFRSAIAFTGNLLAVNRAELKAEVAGRVTRVTVQEGDRVAAGTVLCAQDEDELLLSVQAAEAQLAQAQAQAQQTRRDNDRAQSLLEKRSVTRQAAQQAETNYNAAMAAARAAESNLGLAKTRLRKARTTAPFAGEVAKRSVQPGEMLNPGQPSFEVVDNRKLEILADLPTEALATVKIGMKASFKVAGFEHPFEGRLTQISPSVQADGRTLRVRLEVPNPQGLLKGGLFAEGLIEGENVTQRSALPSSILTATGREAEVFQAINGIAVRRKLTVGPEQNGWRPVEADWLTAGVQIVGQGQKLVVDGTRLQVIQTPATAQGK
ncbi:efflux RND transporter periplasmic adaptor subunit [Holophaga foetida]|uniref:efflux RND transporter periplasmic adaptor subunit n=1 Tax=Holophaga foetida TaxID=35839 RepID=UPI00024749CA|nr:efflux RND transporter periplasmic adaptor subunit [Holophaga foetida]